MTYYKPEERQDLEELYRKQNLRICELEQENKKLKSDVDVYKSQRRAYKEKYLALLRANTELEEENRKLKETIKDHQLYEEKLEHRIVEFEELLHGE